MKRFEGKVAIITGASTGVGQSVLEKMAAEGATVIGVGRNKERFAAIESAQKELGHTVETLICELTEDGIEDRIVKHAIDKYGKLDILVNNAAMIDQHMPCHEVDDKTWEGVFRTNVTAPMQLSRAAIKYWLDEDIPGNIVNVASVGGLYGGRSGVAYTASKHALIGLTKSCAYQYGLFDIRCNAIAPGGMLTEQAKLYTNPSKWGFDNLKKGLGLCPMIGTTAQCADIILFLASEESIFMNGAVVVADGGWTVY